MIGQHRSGGYSCLLMKGTPEVFMWNANANDGVQLLVRLVQWDTVVTIPGVGDRLPCVFWESMR